MGNGKSKRNNTVTPYQQLVYTALQPAANLSDLLNQTRIEQDINQNLEDLIELVVTVANYLHLPANYIEQARIRTLESKHYVKRQFQPTVFSDKYTTIIDNYYLRHSEVTS